MLNCIKHTGKTCTQCQVYWITYNTDAQIILCHGSCWFMLGDSTKLWWISLSLLWCDEDRSVVNFLYFSRLCGFPVYIVLHLGLRQKMSKFRLALSKLNLIETLKIFWKHKREMSHELYLCRSKDVVLYLAEQEDSHVSYRRWVTSRTG